jgi:oligo-1,6-glucosidase
MTKHWWKEAVVYQIYPRSFYDSNGDGIGDLRGIIEKLDYVKNLGADVIWLSPVYKSPNDDNGYDISDYRDIMDEFGTLSDWDELLHGIHSRGMRLIMDLVVNHTSDEHPWFIESRSSKDNPKRDYYIWRPGKGPKEPNNWESFFTGSVWQYDEASGEYYLHFFSKKQPDLNWKNPKVREEIYSMMKWWLDKGIDGFRMDVINLLSKREGLPDSMKAPTSPEGYVFDEDLFANQKGIHDILKEMHHRVLGKYDIMTVGETPNVTPQIAADYVDEDRKELNMVFNFQHMDMEGMELLKFKKLQKEWYEALKDRGWNSQYFSNHDQPRSVSRFGNDTEYRVESAKLLGTVLHTLPGTPYVYQGEEIGMTNVAFPSIDYYNDIATINAYKKGIASGADPESAMEAVHKKSRDNARTPMQWDESKNAGFTAGKPWLGVNPNYREINVRRALADKNSIFYYYKKLIELRKSNPVMVYGSFRLIMEDHPEIMAYVREYRSTRWLVIANMFAGSPTFVMPDDIRYRGKKLIISNLHVQEGNIGLITLRPYEVRVYSLN